MKPEILAPLPVKRRTIEVYVPPNTDVRLQYIDQDGATLGVKLVDAELAESEPIK